MSLRLNLAGAGTLIASVLCLFATLAIAQETALEAERPSATVTRISAAEAPIIDGDLSDAAWSKAGIIDDEILQALPNAGEPGTQPTVLRIMYDENNLYFAVYAREPNPDLIVLRTMARDGNLGTGDFVRFYLDPGMTRRNAYVFDVGPGGARTDGLLENNSQILWEWDTIWQARAQIVADGWVAEVAIPFRGLSYDLAQTDWGFDFIRVIRRNAERDRWSSHLETIGPQDISRSGTLTGFSGMEQGLGLDVQIYGRGSYKHQWQDDNNSALSGTIGGNLFYKLTPALTGTLTVNPDFSDSPLDERQVNTTRFSLFTPETRDFFLQDAAAFEFGGRNFQDADNARPFFSRNIGLSDGQPVTILTGGKLSGEVGGFGVGALSVLTNKTETTDQQLLTVARIARPILAESRIGLMVTNGDPTGDSRNSVAGLDIQYRDSNWFGGNIIQSDFYYERSFSDVVEDDNSFGFAANFPNEPWAGNVSFKQVGSNFSPALGFSNRSAIRLYDTFFGYIIRLRNQYFRSIELLNKHVAFTDLDDRLQSRESHFWIKFTNSAADTATADIYDYQEIVTEDFSLPRDVIVPAGRYAWTNAVASIDTTMGRPWVFALTVECCSFYHGDYLKTDLQLIFRPNETFEITPRHVAQYIDLPTGSVDIHILSLTGAANFTADMQLAVQAQFDNISRNFGFSARYRWEYSPGDELFVALGQSASIPGSNFRAKTTQLSIRLGQTFRF